MDDREIAENMLHNADQWPTGTKPQWESIIAHSLLAVCDRLEDIAGIAMMHLVVEEEEEEE